MFKTSYCGENAVIPLKQSINHEQCNIKRIVWLREMSIFNADINVRKWNQYEVRFVLRTISTVTSAFFSDSHTFSRIRQRKKTRWPSFSWNEVNCGYFQKKVTFTDWRMKMNTSTLSPSSKCNSNRWWYWCYCWRAAWMHWQQQQHHFTFVVGIRIKFPHVWKCF